jgi:hypothetical protein
MIIIERVIYNFNQLENKKEIEARYQLELYFDLVFLFYSILKRWMADSNTK